LPEKSKYYVFYQINNYFNSFLITKVQQMVEERKKANAVDDVFEKSKLYRQNALSLFIEIRYHVDKLELMIDNEV